MSSGAIAARPAAADAGSPCVYAGTARVGARTPCVTPEYAAAYSRPRTDDARTAPADIDTASANSGSRLDDAGTAALATVSK